jgi:hypothetical protein
MIMIIRHAEKPDHSGTQHGIDEHGGKDKESLTVPGWIRAGALVELFAPQELDPDSGQARNAQPRSGLARPTVLFAADPTTGGSKRPFQTITPLAQRLDFDLENDGTPFRKGQEEALASTLTATSGIVLVAWEHEAIPTIASHLGAVTPAPPESWPDERFDLVWVFTRQPDGWTFTQVPQLLLAGDNPHIIT